MLSFAEEDRETLPNMEIITKRLSYSALWKICSRTPNPRVISPCGRRLIICLKLNFSG
jgi:hypothetical protein